VQLFIHFADDVAQEAAARVRQIRYFQECALAACRATPGRYRPPTAILSIWSSGCANYSRKTLRKTLYYSASRRKLLKYLKKLEAVGFDEVILYFNVGLKPHSQIKDEMARFMAEMGPAFT